MEICDITRENVGRYGGDSDAGGGGGLQGCEVKFAF